MPTPPETPATNEQEPPPVARSNIVWVLLATVCALLAMPYGDDRDVESPRRWWRLHDQYLDGIAETLVRFKDAHGRYPDNNEGLYALDTFGSRFGAVLVPNRSPGNPVGDPATYFGRQIRWPYWKMTRDWIQRYRAETGRFPQSGDEMNLGPIRNDEDFLHGDFHSVEVAISHNDCLYLLGPNCVFDPSLTPYIYENRNGLGAKLFAGSVADDDPKRKFSREVAPGVYVYSYNARHYYQTYRGAWLARWGRVYGFGALTVGLFVVIGFRARKYRLGKAPLLFPALAALLAFGASTVTWVSCYLPSSMPRRKPKDLEEQQRLLEKFRESGVINAETYGKAMKAFETDGVFVPPKQSGHSPE